MTGYKPGEYGGTNGGSDVGNSAFPGLMYSSSFGNDVGRCSIGWIGTKTGASAKRRSKTYNYDLILRFSGKTWESDQEITRGVRRQQRNNENKIENLKNVDMNPWGFAWHFIVFWYTLAMFIVFQYALAIFRIYRS